MVARAVMLAGTKSSPRAAGRAGGRRPRVRPLAIGLLVLFGGADLSSREGEASPAAVLQWHELAPLPDPVGLAGAFAGVSGDALLVAGGANFPTGRPWETDAKGRPHAKVWHDRIFALESTDGEWKELRGRLPRPLAYGVSLSWNRDDGNAVLALGGGDATRHYAEGYALRYLDGRASLEELPPMPRAAAFFCGALVGGRVYVAGGREEPDSPRCLHTFWSLDLSRAPGKLRWRSEDPWPGEERMLAVAAAQGGDFYLFSGTKLVPEPGVPGATRRQALRDAYRFRPGRGWIRLRDMPRPAVAAPTPAVVRGTSHILVFGGDDGTRSVELEDAHPGFPPSILAYDVITDRWIELGELPKDPGPDPAGDPGAGIWPPVTTPVVRWRDRIILAGGEARPGVRTARVLAAEPLARQHEFGLTNWLVLAIYLAGLVAMGLYFARRESSADDFFLAGGRIPWWAAGLSIFGTQLSAITYLSIPARAYATDWTWFLLNMGIVAIAPFIIYFYLPFFRRLGVTTAYEYLERRFHVSVRLMGSLSFIVYQCGRMGIVLLLPALALAAVTGMDVMLCIVIMGILSTAYTVLGGIEAVIWTDVLQVIVLVGGALAAIFMVAHELEGGFGQILAESHSLGKLALVRLEGDWSTDVLGVIVVAAIFTNIVPYSSDQAIVQRYLTTRTEKQAARAVWTNAFLTIPASLLFFGLGTALFVFYRNRPEAMTTLDKGDQIVPWFISTQMPAGLAGLVFAGIFAAAMSSLDSSMHSIATALSTDFIRRFRLTGGGDRSLLRIGRCLTLALGVIGTATACLMASFDVSFLWKFFLEIVGLVLGTLGGVFALAVFSRRTAWPHVWIAIAISLATLLTVKYATNMNSLLYAAIAVSTTYAGGLLASFVIPLEPRPTSGLTIFDPPASRGPAGRGFGADGAARRCSFHDSR